VLEELSTLLAVPSAPHGVQWTRAGGRIPTRWGRLESGVSKLYIAAGISCHSTHRWHGVIQLHNVAINKDPEAPIFRHADYGVMGDLLMVPAITKEVRKMVESK